MSTQRRRVLENSGLIIPADGVYIEGLDGKAYTVDKWKGGNDANSIIVASGDVKFRVALTQKSECIGDNPYLPLENYMTEITSSATALSDYDGAGNTAKMLLVEPNTRLAAGFCNAFTFPDGETKGFLPSLGQLNLAYQNKSAIAAALSKCGGTAMTSYYYWSSTFKQSYNWYSSCWGVYWSDGRVDSEYVSSNNYIRPFADIS